MNNEYREDIPRYALFALHSPLVEVQRECAAAYIDPAFRTFAVHFLMLRTSTVTIVSGYKEQIYVWEKLPGMLHEDDAAEALATICRGENIRQPGPSEGKGVPAADVPIACSLA